MADDTLSAIASSKSNRSAPNSSSHTGKHRKTDRADRGRTVVPQYGPRDESMTPASSSTIQDGASVSDATASSRPSAQPSELLQFGTMLTRSIQDMTKTMVTQFSELHRVCKSQFIEPESDSYISSEDEYDSEDSANCQFSPRKRPRQTADLVHAHSDAIATTSQASTSQHEDHGVDTDNVLKNIAEELHTKEKVDAKVNQQLADLVNDLMFISERPDEEKTKQKIDKVLRPDNCHSLVTTKVDELIWQRLRAQTRSFDSRMQTAQTSLVKGVTVITKLLHDVLKVKQKVKDLTFDSEQDQVKKQHQEKIVGDVTDCLDNVIKENFYAIDLFGISNYELNLRRRECLKPDLNEEYFSLFSSAVPINGYLFGGDVSKRLEDIEKTNKVAQRAMGRPKGQQNAYGFRPMLHKKRFKSKGGSYQSGNYRSQKPFLGKQNFRYNRGQKPEVKRQSK